ncbi:MAG: TonB family protein [Acidobacteriota bacterium]
MEDKTRCLRCNRSIDASARICPFCNYEQMVVSVSGDKPATIPLRPPVSPDVSPPPLPSRNTGDGLRYLSRGLMILSGIVVLAATFAVGALVNNLGSRNRLTRDKTPQPIVTDTAPASRGNSLGDLTLVPVQDPTATIGRSITSAPIADPDHQVPSEFQRRDATALPAQKYSEILKSQEPQPTVTPAGGAIDPRTLPAGLPEQQVAQARKTPQPEKSPAEISPTPAPAPTAEVSLFKPPVPIDQPLPDFDRRREIKESGTVHLSLTVGTDGRVHEVRIIKGMEGITARVIAAVQRWKFKPATRNGEPVEATFDTELTFNPIDR